jgi:hypothetical protein
MQGAREYPVFPRDTAAFDVSVTVYSQTASRTTALRFNWQQRDGNVIISVGVLF